MTLQAKGGLRMTLPILGRRAVRNVILTFPPKASRGGGIRMMLKPLRPSAQAVGRREGIEELDSLCDGGCNYRSFINCA